MKFIISTTTLHSRLFAESPVCLCSFQDVLYCDLLDEFFAIKLTNCFYIVAKQWKLAVMLI